MAEVSRAAVVTGGASGIGLEIVRHLAGEGMGVVAVDRSSDACVRARASLAPLIDRVRLVEADIGTAEGAAAGIETAVMAFGRIDLLCNNAAVHPSETVAEHVLETWREAFRVNVDGVMLCSQAALRHMIGAKRGAIVNIGSISGHAPYAGGGAYAATKAAVAMLTRVLALEAGPHGVTVNCIEPGTIRHRSGADLSAAHIPICRAGTPTDVAALVSFLASDAAGYMNGAVITLDGGATAGRARVAKTR